MEPITTTFSNFSDALVGLVFSSVNLFGVDLYLIVIWLFAGMVFFTLRLGFINVRGFKLGFNVLRGKYYNPDAPGELTPFQALATALSGTVGIGNIAGVAIAISLGGPGAAFWMVVIGFFAMSLKCAEVTLAVKYRIVRPDGRVCGGPMWYLSQGFAEKGFPKLGRILGTLYAVCALGAFIQFLQVNQSYSQISTVLGGENAPDFALAYGIGIAILAALVLVGDLKSVAKVTSKLTPLMCLLYLGCAFIILVVNADQLLGALGHIISDAFSMEAGIGGIIGTFVAGMRRAVYSTEAGIGSASIAHAVVKTDYPGSEGLVAILEPFIDTFIVCTATALIIVSTGVWDQGYSDIAMTSAAFATVSDWFPVLLAICVCIFAFSTILAVGYYGQQICDYLFDGKAFYRKAYLVIFCGMLPLGTIVELSAIVNIIDSLFFLLSIPNLIGLLFLSGIVVSEIKRFRASVE